MLEESKNTKKFNIFIGNVIKINFELYYINFSSIILYIF